MTRQRDGLGERGDARSGEKPLRRDAGSHRRLEQGQSLGRGEGVRLAGGSEQRDAVAAFVQQVTAMRDEARMIGGELSVEGRQRGGEHAMRVQR
ncbi:hypothetical protein ACVMBY_009031 [Bradyrhizobium huanghuaihaiense]